MVTFYIHGSVHRDSVLIRSNKMQQYVGIYLLKIYSNWATLEEGRCTVTMTCARDCIYSLLYS